MDSGEPGDFELAESVLSFLVNIIEIRFGTVVGGGGGERMNSIGRICYM